MTSSNAEELTVACVKWGPWCAPHGARYVNNLFQGVSRNLTLPHRFVCFTDSTEGLDEHIEARALPKNLPASWWLNRLHRSRKAPVRQLLSVPYRLTQKRDLRPEIQDDKARTKLPVDLVGWWNKLYLFKHGVLDGRVLYIDLDTVIVGSLDELASYSGDFCILRDFYRPTNYGSGLMSWKAGPAVSAVWDRFVEEGLPNVRRGDQAWIQKCLPDADFFQDLYPGQTLSYKLHCLKRPPLPGSRVICFHGKPRPHEVLDLPWMEAWEGKY